MTLEQFYLLRSRLIRLPGCAIYIPDNTAHDGFILLDGGRAVYLERDGDTSGLAVVNRQVARIRTDDRLYWYVEDEAEQEVA